MVSDAKKKKKKKTKNENYALFLAKMLKGLLKPLKTNTYKIKYFLS